MTTLVFSHKDWKKIRDRICQEYGPNFFLISWRVKRELGFGIRTHTYYDDHNRRTTDMRLDFDDPARATFFQIKYL